MKSEGLRTIIAHNQRGIPADAAKYMVNQRALLEQYYALPAHGVLWLNVAMTLRWTTTITCFAAPSRLLI